MTTETVPFGQYMRRLREEKGIKLEEIAQKTNILMSSLHDIEEENWQVLPEPVFLRGMLRNIASVVGADPQEMIARYNVSIGQSASSTPVGQVPREVLPPLKRDIGRWSKKITWILALVALVLIGFYIYSLLTEITVNTDVSEEMSVSDEAISLNGDTQVSETPLQQTEATAVSVQTVSIEVKAVEKAWFRILDGTTSTDYMLEPGETVHVSAPSTAKLILGNAGGVELICNGTALPALGTSGQVKTISISSILSESSR